MSLQVHVERIFCIGHRVFGESVTYKQQGSPDKTINAIITTPDSQELGSISQVRKKAIVNTTEVSQPKYGDKIVISGVEWRVDVVEKTADGQWELEIRNSEKLVYK